VHWWAAPDLANVLVREDGRFMGTEFQTSSVVRLKRSGRRWFVLIDDEIARSRALMARANQMLESRGGRTVSIDLRPMSHAQRKLALTTAVKRLISDRLIKYELVVGDNTELHAELRQMTTLFIISNRIELVENPEVNPGGS
jgi:hypothetical protein